MKSESSRCSLTFFSIISLCLMCLFAHGSKVKNMTHAVTRQIRSVGFPDNTGMGIFFAASIPLDIPDKSVSVSFYFEANYRLPDFNNLSYFDEHFGVRSFDRRLVYEMLQSKLERAGFPGKVCLMRAICDAAKKPLTKNGLVGDLLHILFTPSSSSDEELGLEVQQAEFEKDCDTRYNECPVNVLDLISYYI